MWLKCNKLFVNIKKTNYVIFKPRQRIAKDDFNIFFGLQLPKQTNVTKFLGVYLDEHPTWKHHISFFYESKSQNPLVVYLDLDQFYTFL